MLTQAYRKDTEHRRIVEDISTGDFRFIDLFSKPYNFPSDPLYVIEDWIAPDPERARARRRR